MNSKVKELLEKLEKLEDELVEELHEQKLDLQYKIEGSKIRFENAVTEAHIELKTGLLQWFRSASWSPPGQSPSLARWQARPRSPMSLDVCSR